MNLSTKIAIGTTIILWASAFAGIRDGLQAYSPFHLALLRFLLASLVLGLVAVTQPIRRPPLTDLPRLGLVGLCGITLYNLALNYGELTVSAGAASFIINTAPIFTAFLSLYLLQERFSALGWLGMLVSFAGVGLIAVGSGDNFQFNQGALFVLGAAVCQSLYFVLQKPLLKKYSSFEVVSYAMWLGTAALLPYAPGLLTTIRQASPSATLAVLYLGIFPAAIAFFCWSYTLSHLTASRAATFLYLVPVATVLIAYIWLGELPTWWTLAGGLLALSGVILVTTSGKPLKVLKPTLAKS
jgi:drug/metabolite transporter (DMT)-like permease